jgi:hypothetical protein
MLHAAYIEGERVYCLVRSIVSRIPVAATEAKLVTLSPLWRQCEPAHYAAWPMFELWAIMTSGRIPRRTLCANRVGLR